MLSKADRRGSRRRQVGDGQALDDLGLDLVAYPSSAIRPTIIV
jgi:hypothetical protein